MKEDTYEDIINLPHYQSIRHPQMPIESRAAQFAPFAALTGYEDAVKETARLTEEKIEIDENLKSILNDKLQIINENIKKNPEITFTYFIYDNKKTGGKYINIIGNVKKIDPVKQVIILTNKNQIPINEIINIKGKILEKNED